MGKIIEIHKKEKYFLATDYGYEGWNLEEYDSQEEASCHIGEYDKDENWKILKEVDAKGEEKKDNQP